MEKRKILVSKHQLLNEVADDDKQCRRSEIWEQTLSLPNILSNMNFFSPISLSLSEKCNFSVVHASCWYRLSFKFSENSTS